MDNQAVNPNQAPEARARAEDPRIPHYAKILDKPTNVHEFHMNGLFGEDSRGKNGLLIKAPCTFHNLDLMHFDVPLIVRSKGFKVTGTLKISHFYTDAWHQSADDFDIEVLEISVPLDLYDEWKLLEKDPTAIDRIKHPDGVQFIPWINGRPDESGTIKNGRIGQIIIVAKEDHETQERACQGVASFNGTLENVRLGENGIHIQTDLDEHGISIVHAVDCVIGSTTAPCKIHSPGGRFKPGIVINDRKRDRVSKGNLLLNIDAPFFDIPEDAAECLVKGCNLPGHDHETHKEAPVSKLQKMSNGGVRKLVGSESEESLPYKDSAGLLTVGIGHLMSKSEINSGKIKLKDGTVLDYRKKGGLTKFEITDLLKDDLPRFEAAVNTAVTAPLRQNEFDSLVHFAFNVGCAAFADSTLVKKINAEEYSNVAHQIRRWIYATKNGEKIVVDGLKNRREVEVDMGAWDDSNAPAEIDVSILEQAKRGMPLEIHYDADRQQKLDEAIRILGGDTSYEEGFNATFERVNKQLAEQHETAVEVAKIEAVDKHIVENTRTTFGSKILNTSTIGIVGTLATGAAALFGVSPEIIAVATGGIGLITNAANWFFRRYKTEGAPIQ